LSITRRIFFNRAPLLAASASALIFPIARELSFLTCAHAQDVQPADLMAPGPLPDHVLGSSTATATIVEYASMTCSHCAAFAVLTYPYLKKEFIDTGKVRYVAREFPLDALAAAASMLIRSVDADRYYPVMELLFKEQRQWLSDRIQPLMTFAVTRLEYTENSFNECLANKDLLDRIMQMRDNAVKFGVSSTPTFFINGNKFGGNMTTRQLEDRVAPYLKT
jgi:protein-disulfide isomerase